MRVVVVGCGIVGAAIAYELSTVPGLSVVVVDRHNPLATEFSPDRPNGTTAALGLLMATVSSKPKGRNLELRLTGLDWYERVIPELEAQTGQRIPVNRAGLLLLQFELERLSKWQDLIPIRAQQQRHLELWTPEEVRSRCPQIVSDAIVGAVYAPDDRQIAPTPLTKGLILAAQQNGVICHWQETVTGIQVQSDRLTAVVTDRQTLECDAVIVAAGIDSFPLTQTLGQPLGLRPVLGQAIHLRLPAPLGDRDCQPVISGHDIHLVPQRDADNQHSRDYWIGATVEFPDEADPYRRAIANSEQLAQTLQQAIDFCPALAAGEIITQWQGIRPRPEGRSAPVIELGWQYQNLALATGHYRNGVLLAPATAIAVRQWLDTLMV
jgi:glycine oxidase